MAGVSLTLALATAACGGGDEPVCPRGKDLLLVNGRILTMDAAESVAEAVLIRDGRIVQVGEPDTIDPCTDTVDLGGRTVIPGLVDGHTHFLRNGQAPGHFVAGAETASTHGELLDAMQAQSETISDDGFLTVVGGIIGSQFEEGRLPNLEELDAVLQNRPIYLQQGFGGPAVTNSIGKSYFESRDIEVWDDGTIEGVQVGGALGVLIVEQTEVDKRRAINEWMAYAASVGLTTVQDQGCCGWFGAQIPLGRAPGYDVYYDLWRAGELDVRLRLRYLAGGVPDDTGRYPAAARMDNAVQGLGDDWMKVVGLGEFVAGAIGMAPNERLLEGAYLRAARRGWSVTQHSGSAAEHEAHIRAMEQVAEEIAIEELRWSLEHVFELTDDQIARLKAIGVGLQNQQYLKNGSAVVPSIDGPPFRNILDAELRASGGTDAAGVSPLNPWLSIYYMVTGKNAAGEPVNDGQQISRLEALRLYTTGSAYFSFDEDKLGSIEAGKLADLVVLDADYLDVLDEELREISSVMTIVGARAVHAVGEFEEFQGIAW
jgi:predicted amidohydrolase YtcJ